MSKAFTFDLKSVEVANRPKFKEPERPMDELAIGKLAKLIDQLEKKLFQVIECDDVKEIRERRHLTYEACILYYQIMEFSSLLNTHSENREIAINLAGLYFSIDFGIVKNVPPHLLAPNGSLFKMVIEHIAEPDVIDFAYILKEKVVKRPPPLFG